METVVSDKPTIYTYYITCHGGIITLINPDIGHKPKIYTLTIPKNIELLTYTQLGLISYYYKCREHNYVCKKYKEETFHFKTPVFKYTQQFPQLTLTQERAYRDKDDNPLPINFYSGIIHCIPESRHDSTKKKEIIHNIDTNPRNNCTETSIRPLYRNMASPRIYNTHEEYSEHYKVVLATSENKREPPLGSINKCGPILLSEAIEIIQQHCQATYPDYERSIIQIHINTCLSLMEPLVDKGYRSVTDLTHFDTYLDTKNDPSIKDTSKIKTYSYMMLKKAFFIQVSKKESYSDGTDDSSNITKYAHCLYNAVRIYLESTSSGLTLQEKKDILPEQIMIPILNAHLMTDAQIIHAIHIILLQIPGKLRKEAREAKESQSRASRKKYKRPVPYPSSKGGKKELQKLQRKERRQRTRRQRRQRKQRKFRITPH